MAIIDKCDSIYCYIYYQDLILQYDNFLSFYLIPDNLLIITEFYLKITRRLPHQCSSAAYVGDESCPTYTSASFLNSRSCTSLQGNFFRLHQMPGSIVRL